MFFSNLSAVEFLALLGGLGGLITVLYLLDRAKRKKVVSTLRFWTSALAAEEKQTRRRMREPWSLILQLASLVLLLFAIAQLQLGTRKYKERNHVLLLDTSAWSAAVQDSIPGQSLLIGREKQLAADYIAALPPRDRVMIVLADALATPITPFTSDRTKLSQALQAATAGYSALNIDQALSYAQQAQMWSGGQPGEIVYVGPKRVDSDEHGVRELPNLRVLSVPCDCEDAGITHIAVKRNADIADEWAASITIRNNGWKPRTLRLNTRFGNTSFAPRLLNIAPQQETTAEYTFVTNSAGQVTADIDSPDALSSDNSVAVALPRTGLLKVAVYTARPETFRPLLEADQRLFATFYTPAQYRADSPADITILDRFSPLEPPQRASLWIQPPRDASPLPIKTVVENAAITSWNATTPLGRGLHARESQLAAAEVFQTFDADIPVASVNDGPVVVARPATANNPKLVAIGFDPLDGDFKFHVTAPLLFANLFHWLSPESLQTLEISTGHVGAATIDLDPNEQANDIRMSTSTGQAIPFTIHDRSLQLFAGRPAMISIASPERERIVSLTLPDVAQHEWTPPAAAAIGLPPRSSWAPDSATLWQWLAILAAIGLLAEWMLFGRRRPAKRKKLATPRSHTDARPQDREMQHLVSR
jgi:hypothetical protein